MFWWDQGCFLPTGRRLSGQSRWAVCGGCGSVSCFSAAEKRDPLQSLQSGRSQRHCVTWWRHWTAHTHAPDRSIIVKECCMSLQLSWDVVWPNHNFSWHCQKKIHVTIYCCTFTRLLWKTSREWRQLVKVWHTTREGIQYLVMSLNLPDKTFAFSENDSLM